ncbi:DUF1840 domain-containing protein [Pelomonas sp. APW6]|uniref:DUF1840 domain-containing protein n=1 Tax=Roseateles subflavus TaxID=3053353 RepID=A0ABT7LET7_9BURK|nr:DUF1840 domain-containing protein [Pelomonas sp. APW6]MDL5031368.1 DUF1840 domain-containing protein [Pelomonas sp. APW6]
MFRFKSKAAADVIYMPDAAQQVLAALGREPAREGIIELADLPAAQRALLAAVEADEAAFAGLVAEAEAQGEPAPRRQGVTLKQRVWPLLDMLRLSEAERADVIWQG